MIFLNISNGHTLHYKMVMTIDADQWGSRFDFIGGFDVHVNTQVHPGDAMFYAKCRAAQDKNRVILRIACNLIPRAYCQALQVVPGEDP